MSRDRVFDSDVVQGVRVALLAASDEVTAAEMEAVLGAEPPCRGVPMKLLDSLLRPLFASHPLPDERTWRGTALELWEQAAYREERWAALGVLHAPRYHAWRTPGMLPFLAHLVRSGASWDLADGIARYLVLDVVQRHPEAATTLEAWGEDDNVWVRRTAELARTELDRGAPAPAELAPQP